MKSTAYTLVAFFLAATVSIFTIGCKAKTDVKEIIMPQTIAKLGIEKPVQGSSDYFTGSVFVESIAPQMKPSRNTIAYVTFEPGARSNWHNHNGGQTLVVTDGIAWTQELNGQAYEAHSGDVIHCPPDIIHWHGASPDAAMTHVSIAEVIDGSVVNWMEPVTDEQYYAAGKMIADAKQLNLQALDNRQQNIITISAFTASGDVGRLKTAINDGLEAGLTVNEIKEIITQLYAYAGFPRSLNALGVFMAVIDDRGGKDMLGKEGTPLAADIDKRIFGTKVQTELAGAPVSGPAYEFSPAIDQFLKEHLFADIFGRGVLNYQERELATISALSAIPGAGAQLQGHLNIGLNTGLTIDQLKELATILSVKINFNQGNNAKIILEQVIAERK